MLNKSNPKISIILATHNRAAFLPRAVDSMLAQTYQDFEIIIVDDASQDETPMIIQQLVNQDNRIRSLRSEDNIGPGAARNFGIKHARGEFIAIMDDDDLSYPHRLETQLEVLEQHPEIDLVFSSVIWVDDNLRETDIFPGIVKRQAFPKDPHEVFQLLYLESNKIPNATIMTHKYLWENYKYPVQPWVGEDWFFFMCLAVLGYKMHGISQPLLKVRRGINRQGLMHDSRTCTFQSQREVLRMIRVWLNENRNHDFDHLHRLALANQVLRESRHFIGFKGLMMIAQALLIAPANPNVYEQVNWYKHKIYQKLCIKGKG